MLYFMKNIHCNIYENIYFQYTKSKIYLQNIFFIENIFDLKKKL